VGLSVTVAVPTGRRPHRWLGSPIEIGWRDFVFQILLTVTQVVVGIMGGVLWSYIAGVVSSLVGWSIPQAWREFFDRGLDLWLEALVFLGLLGLAWVAAERCFARLIRTGDVHYLRFLGGLLTDETKKPDEGVDPTWPGLSDEGESAG
jgi:hypothetical protein